MGALEVALAARALVPLALVVVGPAAVALGLCWELVRRVGSRAERAHGHAAVARGALALGLFALGVARSTPSAAELARLDNVRRVYAGAPTLRFAVRLGASLAPPAAPLAAPSAPPELGALDLRGRDVLLVTLSSARADRLSAYGHARKTSPAFDRLAEEGVLFERAYTPSTDGAHALASLFTGKYVRPLARLGAAQRLETLAGLLGRYGVETAAFRAPWARDEALEKLAPDGLGFGHLSAEGDTPAARAAAAARWADARAGRVFVWVHLDEPREPWVAREGHDFGPRAADRYDAELAAADDALAALVAAFRAKRPDAVIVVTAERGEELPAQARAGGREELLRVPLVLAARGLAPRRVRSPVSLVDLAPTLLAALAIPAPARLPGADLSLLAARGDGAPDPRTGRVPERRALAESDDAWLLARGPHRLYCARASSGCALYDVSVDPLETRDVGREHPDVLQALRDELRRFEASHGRFELGPEDARGLPEPLRRAIGGDRDAALDVAALLASPEARVRQRAAEVLFDLKRPETATALRDALLQSRDEVVRDWVSLALARLGEGAPRARDLLVGADVRLRRLAALALCEAGEDRGQDELAAWLRAAYPERRAPGAPLPDPAAGLARDRAREVLLALARIRSKRAVPAILRVLDDPRLRSLAAEVLGQIGDKFARPALAERLWFERQPQARAAIAKALVALGGREELRGPLVRWMGAPEPLPGALGIATKIGLLDIVGGPRDGDRARLAAFATSGVVLPVIVPKVKEPDDLPSPPHLPGARILCRASTKDERPGELRLGASAKPLALGKSDMLVPHAKPELDPDRTAVLPVPATREPVEVYAPLPAGIPAKPGSGVVLVAYATQNVSVSACAVVPARGDL